jgi:late competence protein required for DNA uptake (superfamily II DNA/RNA helicase)
MDVDEHEDSREREDKLQGVYIVGLTGSGKSTLLQNLIIQDLKQGLGICLIEPHADVMKDILARLPIIRENEQLLVEHCDAHTAGGDGGEGGDQR